MSEDGMGIECGFVGRLVVVNGDGRGAVRDVCGRRWPEGLVGVRRVRRRCGVCMAAGKEDVWAKEYLAYLKRNGRDLCAMCYEGYKQLGRGAVLANYSGKKERPNSEVDRMQGVPSMYVTASKLREAAGVGAENADVEQITRRIVEYDPETQFVMVFEHAGVMGADIVTPNITPRAVWSAQRDEERGQPRTPNSRKP